MNRTAREVLDRIERGSYVAPSGRTVVFADEQAAAQAGTRLYTPQDLAGLRPAAAPEGLAVEVVDATTQVAALAVDGDVCVLNFASARNPGGGFLNGARAQEEDLCRCSGLYPCLTTQWTYYRVNRDQRSTLYTDHMIYSPRVPFFRHRGRGPDLEEVRLVSVITAPAPNTGPTLRRDPDAGPAIRETFERRWGQVFRIAVDQGERNLILGAWGCGAFQGDPRVAAETARSALAPLRGHFERVLFAIPGKGKVSARNLAVFREVLGG